MVSQNRLPSTVVTNAIDVPTEDIVTIRSGDDGDIYETVDATDNSNLAQLAAHSLALGAMAAMVGGFGSIYRAPPVSIYDRDVHLDSLPLFPEVRRAQQPYKSKFSVLGPRAKKKAARAERKASNKRQAKARAQTRKHKK